MLLTVSTAFTPKDLTFFLFRIEPQRKLRGDCLGIHDL